jgi:hypothetical protein
MSVTQETFDQIDSSDLFQSALADEPNAQEAAEPVEAETTGQPRDDHGRFAPKVEAEPVKETTTPSAAADHGRDEANVPSWRLREIAEERRQAIARAEQAEREASRFRADMEALRQQIAQQSAPKPEPVDLFADPNAWAQQQLTPLEQKMQQMQASLTLRASRAENIAIHGRDTVKAAEDAIDEAVKNRDPEIPGLQAKLRASDNPVGVAIEWHKSRSVLKETGGDLNAYREKALEAALNDPAFLAKALERAKAGQQTPSNTIKLPPSLNRVAAAQVAGDDDSDGSDEALFRHAMR